jgi:cytochrome c-type biogenesis protein CcmF
MSLFGRAILLLALATAVFGVGAALAGRPPRRRAWFHAAERAVFATFGLLTIGVGTLIAALATDRFGLEAVANYTSRDLEWYFKLTALWASQPGSLMFWAWLLAGFTCIAVLTNRLRNRELMPVVVATLSGIAVFFCVILSFVSSPFATLDVMPVDGTGGQAALRNPYMIIHPPVLYLGYVSIAVPFAFAIAALVTRRLDSAWLASVRKWTLASWAFLGIGIILGAKWAYESLSFGGYWIWDPVENAALLPWLVGTAFLHSIMVQERRGMLRVWNLTLVISTFALTLFGTFLTRSNIVTSVHNFGAQTVGPWLLGAIIVTLAGGIYLIVTRLPSLRSANSLESYISREAVFLYNNLLLVGLAFVVIWGTLYPVVTEIIRGDQITVGRGFFDAASAPIGVALLFLTGVGPLIPWRKASPAQLRRRFVLPLLVTAVTAIPLLFTDARRSWAAFATFLIAIFTTVCIGSEFWRGAKVRHALGGVSLLGALGQTVARNRRRYGGYIVHIGIVLVIVGIAASRAFLSEGTLVLRDGQTATAGGYTFTASEFVRERDDTKMSIAATIRVTRDGQLVDTLRPKKHTYLPSREPGDEVAIAGGLQRDIWVHLAAMTQNRDTITLRVFVNPMIALIWVGGLVFLLGAAVAGWPPSRAARVAATAGDPETARA